LNNLCSKTVNDDAKNQSKPPKSLGKHGRKYWDSVLAVYALTDEHHFRLLENSALCLDRAAAAREEIAKVGITTTNRFGDPRDTDARRCSAAT
jgi:hypothetical protein